MKPKYARKQQKKRKKLQQAPNDKRLQNQPDVKRVQLPRRTQKSR